MNRTFVQSGKVEEDTTITLKTGPRSFHTLKLTKGSRITLVVVEEQKQLEVKNDTSPIPF